MTPIEQAKKLLETYDALVQDHTKGVTIKPLAKECALIAVRKIKDELILALDNEVSSIHAIYWDKVKQEIERL